MKNELVNICRLQKLEKLNVCFNKGVTDELLVNLSTKLINLSSINIHGCDVSDIGLEAISKIEKLVYLKAFGIENIRYNRTKTKCNAKS